MVIASSFGEAYIYQLAVVKMFKRNRKQEKRFLFLFSPSRAPPALSLTPNVILFRAMRQRHRRAEVKKQFLFTLLFFPITTIILESLRIIL